MEIGLFVLTLGICGLAVFLGLRERTFIYIVALVAGSLGTLPTPIWQLLYRFSYNPQYPALLEFLEYPLPAVVVLAGWTTMIPPLLVLYLASHRWWFGSYLTLMLTYILFVLYHLMIESIGTRAGWWSYALVPALPFGLQPTLIAALMNGLTTLGVLAALLLTRHYALSSLLVFLLPAPLVLQVLVQGMLGAPLYTVLQLDAETGWAGALGLGGTLILVLWGAHILAGTVTDQRSRWRTTV
jgi:hypothetical protein